MVAVSIRHEFAQHFRAPPRDAFDWLTDYTPDDHALMGLKGKRRFRAVSKDTIVIDDTAYSGGRAIRKRKLVKLDAKRLTYYNVLLTGPSRDTLVFYQILPDGDGESKVLYTEYEVIHPKKTPTEKQLAEIAEAESVAWHKEWGNLARAMESDLRAPRS